VASLAARAVPPPHPERLGLRGFPSSFLPVLVLLLPMSVLGSELLNLAHALFPPPDAGEVAQRLVERLDTSTALHAVETAIVVVGIAPVVEEWLYRGVIQQGLVAHLGRLRGVLLTACLFSFAHFEPSLSAASSLATFLATLPVGLILGAVRLATGSLLATILLHASYNGVSLAALGLAEKIPVAGYNAPGDHTPIAILLPAVVAVTAALAVVVRGAREAPVALPIPEPSEEEDDAGSGWLP
jgi:membrane protease YdiL (CAAX protease family)